ncbi:hypothetical protein KA005_37220, partial [bacterium]|nr:hypothetical protein [bacterium]
THTKSDYCKNLIKPLLGKYHIDTLLESLPPHGAKKNNNMTIGTTKSLLAKHVRAAVSFRAHLHFTCQAVQKSKVCKK